jgi:hypothetical protein
VGAGRGNRRGRKEEAMPAEDVDHYRSPAGTGAEQEEYRGVTFGARFFLAITIAVIFVMIVVPLLIWTAGIAAGS